MSASLTIAIPLYDGAATLRRAVESVIAQDSSEWQLLICDDSEPEEQGHAERVVDELELGGDERVRCLRNPRNLGMGANWNRCLDEADNDLVTLLHQDDALDPGYVAVMQRLAGEYPAAAALFCEARIIDSEGRERFSFADWIKRFYLPSGARGAPAFEYRGEEALSALMSGNFIMCPTLCFRRSRLGERRFEPRWKQVLDLEMTSRLLLEGEALVGTSTVAYDYRRHAGGATARQSETLVRFHEELELFDLVAARARERGWPRAASVAGSKRIVKLHLAYRALGHLLRGRFGRASSEIRLALSPEVRP